MENRVYSSVTEAIGKTPLVELSRLTRGVKGRILAKLDYLNPGFSKKDRMALQIIEEAEQNGLLKKGQPVVELTSGNAGTGLSIVCAIKGYHFIAVMSKGNSEERARMMSALGAEVVLVDQMPDSMVGQVSGEDLALVEKEARRITEERGAFRADQFKLKGNFNAHHNNTGPELIKQTGGQIDLYCDFVGSGGTFAGTSSALKKALPDIKCFVVEPASAAVISGHEITNQSHQIQGGGYSMPDLDLLDKSLIDGCIQVTDQEAKDMARRLASEEGIFAGFSSGANVAAALKLIQDKYPGASVATLINDSGLKYLSTDLWD
jgi:cysteine synthase A